MALSQKEIEDQVRKILMSSKKRLDDCWGSVYRRESSPQNDTYAQQQRQVHQAIEQARSLMAEHKLDPSSVAIFERYRIAELLELLDSSSMYLVKGQSQFRFQPEPEPELTTEQSLSLKTWFAQFLGELRSTRVAPMGQAEAAEYVRGLKERTSKAWMERRPLLDQDPELQMQFYQQREAELNRLAQECGHAGYQAAKFEKIVAADLPSGARPLSGSDPKGNGGYYKCFGDGQLKWFGAYRGGVCIAELDLHHHKAQARYEDGANVAEFLPDNSLEEYGGRYERESRYPHSYKHWVISTIEAMLKDCG